jgi:hypothetical protein
MSRNVEVYCSSLFGRFLKIFVPVSHKIRIGIPNIRGFSKPSGDAYEHFTFVQWEKHLQA